GAVDLVAHLFAFVTKHVVSLTGLGDFHEIGKETVQLHARMIFAGEATAAKHPDFHAEITAVFLRHHVRRGFARAENAVRGAVNPAALADAIKILRASI